MEKSLWYRQKRLGSAGVRGVEGARGGVRGGRRCWIRLESDKNGREKGQVRVSVNGNNRIRMIGTLTRMPQSGINMDAIMQMMCIYSTAAIMLSSFLCLPLWVGCLSTKPQSQVFLLTSSIY